MKKYLKSFFFLLFFVSAVLFLFSRFHSKVESRRDNSDVATVTPSTSGWASSASSRAFATPPTRSIATTNKTAALSPPTTEAGALALLQSDSTQAWDLRRDSFTPQIRTLVHGHWRAAEATSPREASDTFVKTYSQALFGVDPARVQFKHEEITDRTRITYEEVVNGTPVYGATLNLFYENGELSRVQNDLVASEPQASAPRFTLVQAFSQYKASLTTKANVSLKADAAPLTVFYPSGHGLVYAYEFSTDETSTTGANSYRVIYDAEEPHVIKRWSSHIQ